MAFLIVLLFIVVLSYNNDANLRDLTQWSLIFGGWFVAVCSLGTKILLPRSNIEHIALGNPNVLATHLVLVLPLAIEKFLTCQGRLNRLFLGFIITTFVVVLGTTKSLGAYCALSCVMALVPLTIPSQTGLNKFQIPIRGVIIATSLLVIAWYLKNNPTSLTDRLQWFRVSFSIWQDHPFAGALPLGGFTHLYSLYRGPHPPLTATTMSHNLYLEILSQWGIVGLALLLITIFLLLLHRQQCSYSWFFKVTMASAALMGCWDTSLLFLPNCLALGGLWIASGALGDASGATQSPQPNGRSAKFNGLHYFLPALVIFLIHGGVQRLMGQVHLIRAAIWINSSYIVDNAWIQAHRCLKQSLRWDWGNPNAWMDLVKTQLNLKAPISVISQQYAIFAQRRALTLNPWNKTYYKNLQFLHRLKW